MENETTKTESSLADTIVKRVTSVPSVGQSMARTQGLMAQSGARGEAELQAAEDDMQAYMQKMVDTIREERSPIDASVMPASTTPEGGEEVATTDASYDSDDPDIKVAGSLAGFVKQFEGYEPKAYWDEKQWSIGYGTKASGKDATITEAEAEEELLKNLSVAKGAVERIAEKYSYDWSANQVDALSSFAYNLGSGALEQLTDKGLRGDEEISQMILEYNKAGGKTLPGLVKRRQAEAKLFTQGYEA